MSTFSKGDRVKYVATDPMVNTPELEGATGSVSHAEFDNVEVDWDQAGLPDRGVLPANLRPIATEPEDTDDVEPEPLKVGDAVLVWATVDHVFSDGTPRVDIHNRTSAPPALTIVEPDTIVRPSAGQVPPWVKPVEQPTGLGAIVEAIRPGDVVPSRFIRHYALVTHPGKRWVSSGGTRYSWDELKEHKVLSEGYMDGGAS